MTNTIYIESKDTKKAFRVDWNDLNASFKRNKQANSNYEISFTLTYTEQFKDVFNIAKEKCGVYYKGQWYNIQQRNPGIDENGLTTMQLTCTHTLIDCMKNIRIDTPEPTEDNPDVSNSDSSSDDSGSDDNQPDVGTVVKKTSEQQTVSLDDCLHKFFDNNDQGIKYELHGNFIKAAVECTGSLYDWINDNLKTFNAYWIPDNLTVKIYDMASLQHKTGKQFRYMTNMTNVEVQSDVTDLVNDCQVYGGKMKKDITSASGGGNGITEPQNGDWTPVIQNAASLVGEHLSQDDINNVLNRIRIESNGSETITNNWDSNAAAGHPSTGLLQFIQSTFDYYSRPPYTDIHKGLDQLIAMMNIPNWRQQIAGSGGWSPHGAPISKATIQASTGGGWGWPFPSVGKGNFMDDQLFGVHPGNGRMNNFHDGLDFGSIDHPGNEVHAVHGGTCTISRAWGSGGINWYCVITDDSGLNVEYQEAFGSASNITVNVGQKVNTGDVIGYRTTDHLHLGITRASIPGAFAHAFSNDGTWIDPLSTIENGGAGSGGGSGSSTTTTTETYYDLHFEYRDEDSIKKYGLHRGAPVVVDSIYDMDSLKAYVEATVQHQPNTTLTISGINESDVEMGDVWRLIAPELNLNLDVTLLGIEGNDDSYFPHSEQTLTFNNTGLAMKDVVAALWGDIKSINKNSNQLDVYGAVGERHENHNANESNKKDTNQTVPSYSKNDMSKFSDFMNGKDVSLNA